MGKDNVYGLEINDDVVIKMASIAVSEIDGVAGFVSKTTDIKDIKDIFSANNYSRSVKVTRNNDSIALDIYISVKNGYDVRTVAESVQENVKTKLQSMTGNAISKVNVNIADVVFEKNDNE